MKKSGIIALVMALAGAVLLTSCKKAPPEAKEVVRPVKLITLAEPGLYRGLTYPARVEAYQEADLSFLVPGRLLEISVKRGQLVTKGEVLAELDPADYHNKYNAAMAYLKEREAYKNRTETAMSRGAATATEVDLAVREYEGAVAAAAIAKKALDDCVLKAPFDGEIGYQYRESFQDVAPKEPIFRLQDVSKLKVIIDVPENVRILARQADDAEGSGTSTRPSVRAKVAFEDIEGRQFDLEFYEDEKTADPVTRTYAVTFVMDAPGQNLILPGMSATVTARVKLPTEGGEPAFLLPSTAVISAPGGMRFVWVQDSHTGKVSRRDVQVGSLVGDEIQVIGGLVVGDIVAVSGANYLQEGQKVRPLEYKARRDDQ